jgi:hypothetical protein
MFNNKPTLEQVSSLERKYAILALELVDVRHDLRKVHKASESREVMIYEQTMWASRLEESLYDLRNHSGFNHLKDLHDSLVEYLGVEYVHPEATLPSYQKIKKEKK